MFLYFVIKVYMQKEIVIQDLKNNSIWLQMYEYNFQKCFNSTFILTVSTAMSLLVKYFGTGRWLLLYCEFQPKCSVQNI